MTNFANWLQKWAKDAIDLAPMLCVLFLGAFLRALQITAGQGAPPRWAQGFMYLATMSTVLLTVVRLDALIYPSAPPAMGAEGQRKVPRGAVLFFRVMQHLCLLLLYISTAAVVLALFTMTPLTAKGTGAIVNVDVPADVQ